MTYEVEAETLEEALELWDEDGPELGPSVAGLEATNFEREDNTDV